ncbi:putative acetyl-CoA synthetase [Tieghemostelium lacteum]|uniref:medium-chain acyl-CoA ligase n=1 Tax=Tieghemostelium lacteum TaxID=361077 RepID=A0A151Z3C0_TIELA|nr:putative acetyl-CoA synthetase [Tieghemostelium lacteum]|eukprot:KYQ88439.1 putative acetyl-CoA synthetase [Tieghemostelium lacteum]
MNKIKIQSLLLRYSNRVYSNLNQLNSNSISCTISTSTCINNNKKNNNYNILNIINRNYSTYTFSDPNENFVHGKDYNEIYKNFKWNIPDHFNIGQEICDKHVHQNNGDKVAVKFIDENGQIKNYTFKQMQKDSNILALALGDYGIKRGDRVGVLLSQGIETVISHSALLRSGIISIPLFTLFGPEALEYRLSNSSSSCLMTDLENVKKLLPLLPTLKSLKKIIVFTTEQDKKNCDLEFTKSYEKLREQGTIVEWNDILSKYPGESYKGFKPVSTKADDPAVIIFTSGTTGNPKGCLHAHRVLIGHLPGVQLPQNLFPSNKSAKYVFYTPADWAWIGGLLDVLLPSLYYGVTVLAHRFPKFDPIKLAQLMIDHKVTTCFLPPTALKMMRQNPQVPSKGYSIISVGSGGESLGDELLDWGRETFNTTINEFYGQTEANLLVGNCSAIMKVKPGSMGKPIPGHQVNVIDKDGNILPDGVVGDIAVKRPDPVIFLKYWENDKATKSKFVGDWLVTGDLGKKDKDGYIWYTSRDDDLINSSGYRIGPSEIEHCLLRHPSVAISGVIGVPDALRGEVVKAYIVLKQSYKPTKELTVEIQEYVKKNLAAHEYPRLIEFIDQLPMTTTGKIIRKDLRELHKKSQK